MTSPAEPEESVVGEAALAERLRGVLVGGLRPGRVVIVDYDGGWPELYEQVRRRIVETLGTRARAVHHIGSTAVPGLAAKPVIDVCVEVDDPDEEAAYLPDLQAAGLEVRVVEPGHRCLRGRDPETNIHVYRRGSPEVGAYLRLRDQLRRSPEDRVLYEATKRRLAGRDWPDVNFYAEAKSGVIRDILAKADGPRP